MATLFYFLLIVLSPGVQFSWMWLFISIIFSFAEAGGRVIYRYTTDKTLAGHEEEI